MNLDQRFVAAGDVLDLATAHATPSAPPAEHRRARRLVVAGAAAVLAAGGAAWWARPPAPGHGSMTSVPQPSAAQIWVPPSSIDRIEVDPSFFESGTRQYGQMRSPSGQVFGVGVGENLLGTLPSDRDRRTVDGTTFGRFEEMSVAVYTAVNECTAVGVQTVEPAWSDEVMAVLAAVHLEAGTVSVRLPAGWTSLGSGPVVPVIRIQFDATIDGHPATYQLKEAVGQPLGSLEGPVGGLIPVDVGDSPGWLGNGEARVLRWERDGVALQLAATNVTTDEILRVATSLVQMPLDRARSSAPPAAAGSTATTTALIPVSQPASCPTNRTLTITNP